MDDGSAATGIHKEGADENARARGRGAPERDRYTLAGETGPPVRQAGAG